MERDDTPKPWTSLTRLRELNGYTQAEFAAVANIKPYTLSRYESGQRSPSPAIIQKFAHLLNVPAGMLAFRDESVDEIEVAWARLVIARHEARDAA